MKKYCILALLALNACQQKHQLSKISSSFSDLNENVPVEQVPPNTVRSGNLGFTPVLFGLSVSTLQVYIKASRNEAWEEIEALQKEQPTYVYDKEHKQLRFQNCEEGWAYAVTTNLQ